MKHFKRREFACKCGCGFDTVDIELLPLCEHVRALEGAPVIVTNGCRCPNHNRDVGGAEHSQHLLGRAADLAVEYPKKTYQMLCNQYPNKYGFGLYDTFVHVDTRTKGPARWDKRKHPGAT